MAGEDVPSMRKARAVARRPSRSPRRCGCASSWRAARTGRRPCTGCTPSSLTPETRGADTTSRERLPAALAPRTAKRPGQPAC
eukprot:4008525-Pleurochrysis_carterae.AAC.3